MLVAFGMPFTIAILAVVLSYTWFFQPRSPSSFVVAPVVSVLVLGAWSMAVTGETGVKSSAFTGSLRATALITTAIVIVLLATGATRGTLRARTDVLASFPALIAWGGGQQWILQTVFLREAQRVTSRRAGIVVAAALFASLHLPNPWLTTLTLVGAVGWGAIYDRYPNVVPLALSHAIATVTMLCAFDEAFTGRLRVGLAYLAR